VDGRQSLGSLSVAMISDMPLPAPSIVPSFPIQTTDKVLPISGPLITGIWRRPLTFPLANLNAP